jgi:hypothetical protein
MKHQPFAVVSISNESNILYLSLCLHPLCVSGVYTDLVYTGCREGGMDPMERLALFGPLLIYGPFGQLLDCGKNACTGGGGGD